MDVVTDRADSADSADSAGIAEAKRLLRKGLRQRRAGRPPQQRASEDEQRFVRVRDLLQQRLSPSTGAPRRLAAYLSTGTEPDSRRLVAWAVDAGIEVLLPVLTDGAGSWLPTPRWSVYAGHDGLREGRSGILEPSGPVSAADALAFVDLMVLPGLAADPNGHRLGRGGGWYDRARVGLPQLETWLLLNDDELLDAVPADSWDLPVDLVVTGTRAVTTTRA